MRGPSLGRGPVAVLGAALAAVLLFVPTSANASDPEHRKQQVDQGIQELRQALDGTSAQLTAAALALQQTRSRLPVAQAELDRAEASLAEARSKDAELASRLAAATESQAKANRAIADGAAEVAAARRALGQIASQAYRGGTLSPVLAVALSAKSPADFADQYVIVDTALRSQNSTLARLGEQQALRANARARLAAVRVEIDRLKREAAANLEVARRAEADAAARKAEVDSLAAAQTEALAVIEARRAEEMSRLDQLQAEQAALEAQIRRIAEEERRRAEEQRRAQSQRTSRSLRGPAAAEAPPPSQGGRLLRPVGGRVSSPFGYRIHPIYGVRRLHTGTDFAGACATPVRAPADGTVVRAGAAGAAGNMMVVNHGSISGTPVSTAYKHLQGFAVRSGRVQRGQVIAYVGTTGASTGCHLHFEVYDNGSPVDPMGWL